MKKRLRRKLHLKEFSQFGYQVVGEYNKTDTYIVNLFVDNLITKIESLNLYCAGGFTTTGYDFIFYNTKDLNPDRKSARTITTIQKEGVLDYLLTANIPHTLLKISNPINSWYDQNTPSFTIIKTS